MSMARTCPPPARPNIMMAAGGTQLTGMSEHDDKYFQDDGIYYWKVHVDWHNPENTKAERTREDPGCALSFPLQRPVE